VLISANAEASLLIAPPLIVSDGELETILVALDRALAIADKTLLADSDASKDADPQPDAGPRTSDHDIEHLSGSAVTSTK
jgi:hypothetical protein